MKSATQKLNQTLTKVNFLTGGGIRSSMTSKPENNNYKIMIHSRY